MLKCWQLHLNRCIKNANKIFLNFENIFFDFFQCCVPNWAVIGNVQLIVNTQHSKPVL